MLVRYWLESETVGVVLAVDEDEDCCCPVFPCPSSDDGGKLVLPARAMIPDFSALMYFCHNNGSVSSGY